MNTFSEALYFLHVEIMTNLDNYIYNSIELLSCQPRVTVTPCFIYIDTRDLYSIDHMCINPIHRIGLIHK